MPDGGRRATFTLTPDGDRGADMRVYLRLNEQPVSETWSYLWEPPRVP
ncbi:MAG: glucan biosynthesis protein [Longimicrobiales bacterium]